MRFPVWAHGGFKSLKCLFLLALLLLLVSPSSAVLNKTFPISDNAIYNQSFIMNNDSSTPFIIWCGAIIIGIILILLSLMSGLFSNGEEGLVSILSWIPISYAIFSSFAVDMITGFGVTSQPDPGAGFVNEYALMELHTIYHFDVVAVCLFVLLAFAIGNTYRIWVSQKKLREYSEMEV